MLPPIHLLAMIEESEMVCVADESPRFHHGKRPNDSTCDGPLFTFGDSPLSPLAKFMHSLVMEKNSLNVVVDNANTHGSPPTFPKMPVRRSNSYPPNQTRNKKPRVQRSKSYPHESRWKSEPILLAGIKQQPTKTLKDSLPVLQGRGCDDGSQHPLLPRSLIENVMLPKRRGSFEDNNCTKLVMPVRRGSSEGSNKSPMRNTSSLPSLSLTSNNNNNNNNNRSTAELIAIALDELILDDGFDFSDEDDEGLDLGPMPVRHPPLKVLNLEE